MIKRIIAYIYYPISAILIILSFIILCLPISLIVFPFKWNIRLRLTSPFWKVFGKFAIYFVCRCKTYLEDHRPEKYKHLNNPPGLYVANHQSFIDIPLMLITCQIPPIMKKEILYIPIFGLCAYSSGAMIVDRKKGQSRRKVFKQAQDRLSTFYKNLQYYPEGTRQKGNKPPRGIDEIKKPLMIHAYKNNIPVFPVSMYGTPKVLNPSGLIRPGQKLGKIMHTPCNPSDYKDENDFCEAIWSKVTQGYFSLQDKLG